ncbi:MAG: prolyl-tRNA synthetase associated domain-containing protein [Pseudomonadota bacterium]
MTHPAPTNAARQDVFDRLDALGVAHETFDHPAFFTVEEGRAHKLELPGGHSKNLFLKDKGGALFLAVAFADTQVDLKALSKRVAKGRLSFGSPELLLKTLGVTPGSVTPFALLNDQKIAVNVILDHALLRQDPIYFHPLENTASTAVSPEGLLTFLRASGHDPLIVDLARPLD